MKCEQFFNKTSDVSKVTNGNVLKMLYRKPTECSRFYQMFAKRAASVALLLIIRVLCILQIPNGSSMVFIYSLLLPIDKPSKLYGR